MKFNLDILNEKNILNKIRKFTINKYKITGCDENGLYPTRNEKRRISFTG